MRRYNFLIKVKNYIYFKLFHQFEIRRPNIIINYKYKKKKLNININHGFQSRNEASVILFLEAFCEIKEAINRNFSIIFFTGDYPILNVKCLSFSKSEDFEQVTTIPNFDFAFWKEAGILDYQIQIDKIIEKSKFDFEIPKLFWIGNVKTNKSRLDFYEKFSNINLIECRHFEVNSVPEKDFVSLEDHCKFKYLIDIQGNGYSGRIKYLLFTGRPLFIQERKYKTYYHDMLVPYEHYVPVEEDFSDLISKLTWLEENPEIAENIAKNAKEFAINNLQKKAVINTYSSRLLDFINSN